LGEAHRATRYCLTLFDIERFGSTPWDPEDLAGLPITFDLVNEQLRFDGLRVIRVEPSSGEDDRQAYFLVRLDGREISPPRIYGKLRELVAELYGVEAKPNGPPAKSLFPHGS
jgi:hypothetical protein